MQTRSLMQTRILIQRKHAKRVRRLQEDDIMSTCMWACFFTSVDSKADLGHENHQKGPLELAILMQVALRFVGGKFYQIARVHACGRVFSQVLTRKLI